MAIDGDTIAAGAPGHLVGQHGSQGAVFTFASAGPAARTQTAELTASDGAASDLLGASVAIDGDTIVAGAPTDDGAGRGSAYTFSPTGAATRAETAKLTPSDSQVLRLGSSVEIDGDTIVVGASGKNHAEGSVYTFARTGPAVRTETAQSTASDAAPNASLGASVAVDAATIVAEGALSGAGANRPAGAAYTFARTGAKARAETAKLTDPDGAPGDGLGQSIAIDAGTTVAGSPGDDVGTNLDQGLRLRLLPAGAAAAATAAATAAAAAAAAAASAFVCEAGFVSTQDQPEHVPCWALATEGRAGENRDRDHLLALRDCDREAQLREGSARPRRLRNVQEAGALKPRQATLHTLRNGRRLHRSRAKRVKRDPVRGILSRSNRLSAGVYKLTATPTDSAHHTSRPRIATLTITPN